MSIKVEFGLTKSGSSFVYNDITEYVKSYSIDRGKSNELTVFDSGTCSVQLSNVGRVFDPSYAQSPFSGQIAPGGGLRVWIDDQIMFAGYIRSWDLSYDLDGQSLASVHAQDAFSLLVLQNMDDYSPSGTATFGTATDYSHQRINTVLNHIGWATSLQNIPTVSKGVLDQTLQPSEGTSVLAYLQTVEASEPGKLFVDAQGRVTFRNAYDSIYESAYTYTRQNISNNPSFESDTYNWPYLGGTALPARSNVNGGAFVYSGSTVTTGSYSLTIPAGSAVTHLINPAPDTIYTASAFFRSAALNSVSIVGEGSTDGTAWTVQGSSVTSIPAASGTASADWYRASLSWTPTSDYNLFRLRVSATGAASMDAVLVEAAGTADTYFDGVTRPANDSVNTYTGGWN